MTTPQTNPPDHRLCVAPMLDWTTGPCRFFHRRLSRRTRLYTEMVVAEALIRGDREKLLGHDPEERPLALQIGGSDPRRLAEAARIGAEAGYDEINLNVGCPSDRVQSGTFGACLMRSPDLVAEGVAAMIRAVGGAAEITVKCRIGVDDQEPRDVLPDFIERVSAAGCGVFIVHARKAWLKGLSPKENREIPPLDHELVHEVKAARPDLRIILNGGVESLDVAEAHLARGLDGVMIGRAAWRDPVAVLASADRRIYGEAVPDADPFAAAEAMRPYLAARLAEGWRLGALVRPMIGLFLGRPGARLWRQRLSEGAAKSGPGLELFDEALAAMRAETLRAQDAA
ncbi:tRNA dihydrouridine(20/20a) synthase DusA [Neomegalonema sp.]|uniref:tRNA dihydrouridine(20/20a) synthase DusA n=1 Tax=Neomegalonema sp. TaxID=2039713 RepID=UPI00260527C3|nr:tRNA dihydrouridine(20/20a) synthase DusA [Neomegalonema sp.]MDD2869593.1 tRNA dihydrouridine(20/20a) synthase DusA [Neomegalonema sp.]